jgi:hypothetical protein
LKGYKESRVEKKPSVMRDCGWSLPKRTKYACCLWGHHIRSLFASSSGYLLTVHEVADGFSLYFQHNFEQRHIFIKIYRLRFYFNFLQNIQIKQHSFLKMKWFSSEKVCLILHKLLNVIIDHSIKHNSWC